MLKNLSFKSSFRILFPDSTLHARSAFHTRSVFHTAKPYFINPAGIYFIENASAFSLVEVRGFEPLTPCLQGRCSPS